MFTGIIEKYLEYSFKQNSISFDNNDPFWDDCSIGDSISVNGICLTIRSVSNLILFDLLNETINLTNISNTTFANVEKALKKDSLLGGHIVSGHVIETGKIINIVDNIFTIEVKNKELLKYKDSITVNGISLTIHSLNDNTFEIHIIPHTFNVTTLHKLKKGDLVNIEYSNNSSEYPHEYFMNIALEESLKGRYSAPPNPWVGCVITDGKWVVSKGYHLKPGEPHAELNAINNLPNTNFKDLTMYITLEPCCHYGKTGPCCEYIVKSGLISKVVIGILDPDHRVSGKGVEYLENNGISVQIGILKTEIKDSLRSYICSRTLHRPYVLAKIALSEEGNYCVGGQNVKLTSEEKQLESHTLRAESQCIIIGSKTAIIDNPHLTVRNGIQLAKQPLKVVIDSMGIVTSQNLMNENTLIYTSDIVSNEMLSFWESHSVKYVIHSSIDINKILKDLFKRGIIQCLLEGGGELQRVFDSLNLIDEIIVVKGNESLPNGKKWLIDEYKYLNGKRIVSDIDYSLDIFSKGMVIVMDDVTRENEGDLIINAEVITEDMLTFIKNNTTGIICVTLTERRALELELPLQVFNNSDSHGTAFTITCDSKQCKTGVSSKDRLLTIKTLLNGKSDDLNKPGHIFPLIARKGGLSVRRGHTEASIDLCKLSKNTECAVICEMTNDNGTMMKLTDCKQFSEKWNIPIITTEQIYQRGLISNIYSNEPKYPDVLFKAKCKLVTREYGNWELISYTSINGEIKVMRYNNCDNITPMVRIHSECFTGDVLGSSHCDCGTQLNLSLKQIFNNGHGVIIFPYGHEGRGIGFTNKIKAYSLIENDSSIDTYKANNLLGFNEDNRNYSECIGILKELNFTSLKLLTTNPEKIKCISPFFNVDVINLNCGLTTQNERYLTLKAKKHGFVFPLPPNKNTKNIAIVHSMWYSDIIEPYVSNISLELGIPKKDIFKVPGSFEIPLKIKQLINEYDILIGVGCIIKGETYHFEVISHTISDALMKIQLDFNKPVINNILNCYTLAQVNERFENPKGIVDTVKFLMN